MIALKAPAKINLSLRVLGRRLDGYHDIDSVMQMVGLYDDVAVAPGRRGFDVFVEGADLPGGPGNLVYDAATALAKAAGVSTGASIRLTKRIPIGAGLGGGSSDAAAALMALNRLWRLRWTRTRLAELGAGLGSDVPFFFFGPTARVAGRGELVARAAAHGSWAGRSRRSGPCSSTQVFRCPRGGRSSD
jgi:4-diphosphocytidyl-2-C-methyl-D-erythritol kinase